ncbi:MAG: T9SS type A sorting domain-containing protein [Bacteroidia bacterium]
MSNISNNGVTITLSNPTGDFEYVVNTSATAPASGASATGNTVDVTSLGATTAYYAHVRSVCGSNFSSWASSPFSTLANPVGLVTYLFTGCTSCPSSPATTADIGVTATNYIRGAGIAAGAGSDYYNNNGFNLVSPSFATANSQGDYVSFTVEANPGFQVTYTSLDFTHRKSGTGPGNTRVGYSTNGGATWTYMVPDPLVLTGTGDVNVSWTFPTAFSTSNTVLFRIWAWGATAATGTYRNDNVILSGYVSTLCNNPVTQSTDVIFSNQTNTSSDISWTTAGTSDLRKVFISNTTTGSPTLADGTDYNANTNFGSGDNVGSWFCIYSGTGNTVSVSNLLPGQTYRVFVANANCSGIDIQYLNSTAVGNPANVVTTNVATPVLSSGPLSDFGSSCVNFDIESQVLISGSVLNGSNVTVTAPAGFAVTLVSGESYTGSVTLPYTGSTLSTPVYVRFLPTSAISYSTNLTVAGGGATSISVPVSGTGINIPPSVSTGSASFIGTTGATLAGSLSFGCASVFSAYGIEYSVSPAFTPGNGAIVQSDFTGNNFSVPITNLGINTVYYYRAYGINNSVTYYGVVGSFSTLSGAVETIYNYGDNTFGAPFYVHPTVVGSNVARSASGWTNSTPCGSGFSGFGITSAATTFNAATNAYVEATITPNVVGNQVEIERISVQLRATASAANQVMLAYSIDEGATWVDRGLAETPSIGTDCGVTSSNTWLLPTPVTVGSPLAASSFRIRLYYYNTSGLTGGNNQILNLVVLGRILQSPNTYYTVSGGNFNDAIWSPSSTGTVGAQVDFTPEINAVIQSGDIVVLNASDVLVKNLTIQSGANLRAASTDFSNMRNLSIYGNLSVTGSIGNGSAFDAIGLNIEGSNTIISGSGAMNVGRIRKQSNFNTISNLTIQSNINVRFPGAAIYNNAPNSFFNVTLIAGRFLSVTGSGGTDGIVTIDGTTDNDIDQKAGSFTINGNLNINGNLSVASSNNINPYISSLNIGATGLITVKNIDVKINAVNSTTIAAGGRINVSGVMKQRQGTLATNGGVTLGVGAILLHGAGTPGIAPDPGGLITGNIRVRAQGTTAIGVYNYWSAPVAGASLNTIIQNGSSSGSALNTYKYDANGATDITVEGLRAGWIPEVGGSIMTPGLGYITTSAGGVQFNGVPNNGDIFVTALHGSSTDFNLVGNPYPGPIDAAIFMAANQASNIIPAIYFWDDDATLGIDYTTNDYIVTNAVGTVGTGGNGGAGAYAGRISTGQSFFVEARSAAPTIIFNNSMRTTGTATFFQAPSEFEKLWLRVNGNDFSNEALLAFGDQATDAYDDLFDAKKIAANSDIALYTTAGEMNFAIQAMSSLTESKIVPVGLDASQAGIYTFSIANMEGINPTVLIYLEDRLSGTFHNLRVSDYNANITEAITGDGRFYLHFSKPVSVSANAESCSSNDGSIIIENASSWNYSIVNGMNQLVAQGSGSIESSIDNLAADSYVITLSTQDGYSATITTLVDASSPVSVSIQGESAISTNVETTFAAILTGATSITWDFGDGSSAAAGSLVNHSFMTPGIYTVTAFASNETCSSQSSFEVRVEADVTGINNIANSSIKIFPNPANDLVTVVSSGNGMIQITDITGKVMKSITLNNQMIIGVETSDLANGVYLVTIIEEGIRSTQRLVISH